MLKAKALSVFRFAISEKDNYLKLDILCRYLLKQLFSSVSLVVVLSEYPSLLIISLDRSHLHTYEPVICLPAIILYVKGDLTVKFSVGKVFCVLQYSLGQFKVQKTYNAE